MPEPHMPEARHEQGEPKGPDKPVPSGADAAAEQRRREKAGREALELKASNSLNAVVELHKDDELAPAMAEAAVEWRMNVKDALLDPKGSVTKERPELAEPMALLAERAFRILRLEGLSKEAAFAARQEQAGAKDALNALMERYPSGDKKMMDIYVKGGRLGTAGRDVVMSLEDAKGFGGLGLRLDTALRDKELLPEQRLHEIDTLLDAMSSRMSSLVEAQFREVSQDNPEAEANRVERQAQVAALLPQLKALRELRSALSQHAFKGEKSPEEVIALMQTRENLSAISPGEKNPEKKEELPKMTFKEASEELSAMPDRISVEDAKRKMTPEMKQAMLEGVLARIDDQIARATRLGMGGAKGRLGSEVMSKVFGFSDPATKSFSIPFVAAEGRIPSPQEMLGMNVADYVKKVLGYDLAADPNRAAELRRLTNLLD